MSVVIYEIENRGQRNFVLSPKDVISGGIANAGLKGETVNVTIVPDSAAKVTEACGKKLLKEWPKEVKLIRKSTRKE